MISWVPIALFSLYHSFNIYTDIKYRITKNIWHLLFLISGLVYFYLFAFDNPWYHPLISMVVALIVGLFLESFRISSPGDTKMFVVTSLLLGLIIPHHGFIRIPFAVILFHLLLISIITYIILFKRHGVIKTLRNQFYDIRALFLPGVPLSREVIFEHFPGAVTITFGSIIYYLLILLLGF